MVKKRIVHMISSLGIGGAERVLVSLCQHSDLAHYEHHVIYFYDGPLRKEIEALGIPAHHVTQSIINPQCYSHVARLIDTIEPDLIHSLLWRANLTARMMKRYYNIPVVNALHALPEHEGKIRNSIDRYIPAQATHYISVSPAVTQKVEKACAIKRNVISTIPNGIDIDALADKKNLSDPGIADIQAYKKTKFIIGTVARLEPVKNIPLLINAFEKIHNELGNAYLVIIGRGSQLMYLQKMIKQKQLDSCITIITDAIAYPYYQYFDCFVQTSTHVEACSIVMLEALAYACPTILTDNKNNQNVLFHGYDVLFSKPTTHHIAKHIASFIQNTDMRHRIARQGQQTIQKHRSLHHMIAQYDTCFSRLLGCITVRRKQ
jgi:glycosyltransferase involved in cell wall biosynthesis